MHPDDQRLNAVLSAGYQVKSRVMHPDDERFNAVLSAGYQMKSGVFECGMSEVAV